MNNKLDNILASLKSLKRRVRRIEEDINDNNINVNEKFAKVSKFSYYIFIIYILTFYIFQSIIKNVAKELFANSIYPIEDEFKEAMENYIITNHLEFYKSLNEKRQMFFYNNYIYSFVSS